MKANVSPRFTLAVIAAVIFLVPIGLICAYIWSAGLDLRSPSSAREWIGLCARGREDVYCKSAVRIINRARGPVIFLHPNKGDHEMTADLIRWKGRVPTVTELDELVGANLFLGSRLSSGAWTALGGQVRKVTCTFSEFQASCKLGGLDAWMRTQPSGPGRRRRVFYRSALAEVWFPVAQPTLSA